MGRYVSDELFHFVGRANSRDDEQNYALLIRVLKAGCISHPPHEVGWGQTAVTADLTKSLLSGELFVPQVTCYCDIPQEHLDVHIAKYN